MRQRSQQFVQSSVGPGCDREKIAQVHRLLDQQATQEEVLGSISALSDAELMSFGLGAYRMNMLSVFGATWPQERVLETARAAAINKLWFGWQYFHHYLPRLAAAPGELQLRNLPLDLIGELLARGRGLVIATFHQGHFRYIASDLASAGIATCVLLDGASLGYFELALRALPDHTFRIRPRVVNADEIRGCVELAITLSKGGCVYAMLDGNTGLDGPRGNDHRTEVEILGCHARVKNGLVKMAAHYGVPILPVFAHTIGGQKQCHSGPIIDPLRPLARVEAAGFVAAAVRELYQHFVQNVLAYPAEWNGCDHFHKWRVPDAPREQQVAAVEQRLMRDLEAGARATINGSRIIVDLSRDDDVIWTDVKTLRCYRMPAEMIELVQRLTGGGVDVAWLARQEDTKRSRMWRFLLQLASRDAIEARGARTPVAMTA